MIINHSSEIISARLNARNVDDKKPVADMANGIFGDRFRDKDDWSAALKETLKDISVNLVTRIRRNIMKAEHTPFEKTVLSKRSVAETVFDERKISVRLSIAGTAQLITSSSIYYQGWLRT